MKVMLEPRINAHDIQEQIDVVVEHLLEAVITTGATNADLQYVPLQDGSRYLRIAAFPPNKYAANGDPLRLVVDRQYYITDQGSEAQVLKNVGLTIVDMLHGMQSIKH